MSKFAMKNFYTEYTFKVHSDDATSIVTCRTIPAGVPENVAKLFPTLDKKIIEVPKKSKPNIFDRLCQADKEFNTKLKTAIAKNSLAPI